MHVQLTPVVEPPSDEQLTAAKAAMRSAQYSGSVADIEAANRIAESVEGARSWLASINGGDPIPVLDYAVSPGANGVALNLVLPVDAVSIGDASLGQQPEVHPAAPEPPAVKTWGDPSVPDPRENIPGWQPEKLGGQVAQSVMSRLAAASRRVGLA